MARKTRQFKVTDGKEEHTVTKMGRSWSCSCKTDDCKHIQFCKLEVLLEKRPKKATKPEYHIHDMVRVRKDVLLMLKLEDVSEHSQRWRWGNDILAMTKSLVQQDTLGHKYSRSKKPKTSAPEFVRSTEDYVFCLPGITKKRRREIYLEFLEQTKQRERKNGNLEVYEEGQREPWPLRIRARNYRKMPLSNAFTGEWATDKELTPGVIRKGERPDEEVTSKRRKEIVGTKGDSNNRRQLLRFAAWKKLERLIGKENFLPAVRVKKALYTGTKMEWSNDDNDVTDLGVTEILRIRTYLKDGRIVFDIPQGDYRFGADL